MLSVIGKQSLEHTERGEIMDQEERTISLEKEIERLKDQINWALYSKQFILHQQVIEALGKQIINDFNGIGIDKDLVKEFLENSTQLVSREPKG